MATAQRSSKEASERTALSLILQSATGVLSSQPFSEAQAALTNGGSVWMGFERDGRYLGRTNSAGALDQDAFYRVHMRPANATAATNSSCIRALATISYPPPDFNQAMNFPFSLVRYGPQY